MDSTLQVGIKGIGEKSIRGSPSQVIDTSVRNFTGNNNPCESRIGWCAERGGRRKEELTR